MAKKGEQKKVTVDERKYTLQHPGMAWVLKNNDECKNRFGVPSDYKLVKSYLDNVVVQKPDDRKEIDDFGEDLWGLLEECKSFLGTR